MRKLGFSLILASILMGCGATGQDDTQLNQWQQESKAGCDAGKQSDCIRYSKILDYKIQRSMAQRPQVVIPQPTTTNCVSTSIGVQCNSY
ncbi:hypothetical protein [Candidatus Binatus sp.]|uniref:hypothetical protein n=1 Tax=Candidatus Binatus sp. TaxID=2811406 RepID=UPI003CC6CDF1